MIKLIILKENNIVKYVNAEITDTHTLLQSGRKDNKVTNENATVVEVSKLPEYFQVNDWTYDFKTGVLSPTPEYEVSILPTVKNEANNRIDIETSEGLNNGFYYTVSEEQGELFFNYTDFDRENFMDSAIMAVAGLILTDAGLPTEVTWNAYKGENKELVRINLNVQQFLGLYTRGALTHKMSWMGKAGIFKERIKAASKLEEIKSILEDWSNS